MNSARIGILGPMRSRFGDVEATLSGVKLRSILAVLAFRADDNVSRDELIEELDLTRTTGDAINALHAHVARLRRWLHSNGGPPDMLETVNSGYRLNIDPAAVDAHRFTTLVERALNLAPEAPKVVAAILEDALSLWRGDALPDTLDGPLTANAADQLHQWRAAARETLIDAWTALGNNQKVVLNAHKFISENPLNESIHTRHILALRRMGRYAEAAEAYQRAEQVLQDELGVRPGHELRSSITDPDGRMTAPVPASDRYQLLRAH